MQSPVEGEDEHATSEESGRSWECMYLYEGSCPECLFWLVAVSVDFGRPADWTRKCFNNAVTLSSDLSFDRKGLATKREEASREKKKRQLRDSRYPRWPASSAHGGGGGGGQMSGWWTTSKPAPNN